MAVIVASIRSFDDYSVSVLKSAINDAQKNNQKIFPLAINTPGGSVYHLLQMIDLLKASGMKIVTTLNGIAMSAGAVLFASGDERYMSENSSIMIHSASYMGWGKHADIKNLTEHVEDLNKRLYSILNTQSGQPDGYFENLFKENNNSDLYLTAEQALEHGLVTAVKVPDVNEIMSLKTDPNLSIYERTKVFMQLSDEYEDNIRSVSSSTSTIENISNPVSGTGITAEISPIIIKQEEKSLNLTELLASLSDTQKAPILALQSLLATKETEVTNLNTSLSAKETEIQSLQTELKTTIETNDKEYITALIKDHKLPKNQEELTKEILSSLSGKAKENYKNQLNTKPKIVPGEIEDFGENEVDLSNGNDSAQDIAAVRAYCKKNNIELNEASSVSIQNAFKAYSNRK